MEQEKIEQNKNRFVEDLSAKEYHSLNFLSKSKLDNLKKSPEYFKYSMENEIEESTDAMDFGSLFHCLLLTPGDFQKDFAIEPEVNKRTNEGKAVLEQFYADNEGKTIISKKDVEAAALLIESVKNHPIAGKLVEGGKKELTIFWEEDGIQFKGRLDQLKDGIIVDYKTTTSASPEDFAKKAYDYGYHKQAYLYSKGYEIITKEKPKAFIFVAVEKAEPYSVCVFVADDTFMRVGQIETEIMLDTYKRCSASGNWYGYNGENPVIIPLSIPRYIENKYMEEIDQ